MATKNKVIKVGPGGLDIEGLWRGDPLNLRLFLRKKGTTDPVEGLPTDGWRAQLRPRVGGSLLASFEVDASEAAAGIIYLILPRDVTTDFPAKVVYDLQRDDTGKTYAAGTIVFGGQVTL